MSEFKSPKGAGSPFRLVAPLVGAYHRPPARQVLASLPAGTQLVLVPEPENPYDSKAIKVFVQLDEALPISQFGALDEALGGTGFTAHELVSASEPFQLGYLADSDGKPLAKLRVEWSELVGNAEVGEVITQGDGAPFYNTVLVFGPQGQPGVEIVPVEEVEDELLDDDDE